MGKRNKAVISFISDPIGSFKRSEQLQIWGMLVTAGVAAIDLAGLFPSVWGKEAVVWISFVVFGVLAYAHIRSVHKDRDKIRDGQITSTSVLGFLKHDVADLQNKLTRWMHDVKDIEGADNVQKHIDTIWSRAGEDLRIGMTHGLFREERYVGLWSCIKVAENSPTTGADRSLGAAVLLLATSWWEQESEDTHEHINDRLKFGLKRLAKEIDARLNRLHSKLGD